MTLPRWDEFDADARARVAKFASMGDTWEACVASIGRWFGIGPVASYHLADGVGYGAAAPFDRSYKTTTAQSSALRPALNAYQRNMQRVDSMFILPLALIYWTARTTKNACAAAAELNLPVLDALSPDLEDNALFRATKARLEKNESEGDLRNAGGDGGVLNALAADFGANHIQRLLVRQNAIPDSRDAFIRGGVESILFSMVTASYAAFETLMTDVWVAAVNSHPDPLASNWLLEHGSKANAKRLKNRLC